MLVDKKILAGGVSMIVVGMILSGVLADMTPIGREGMTEEEKYESVSYTHLTLPTICSV